MKYLIILFVLTISVNNLFGQNQGNIWYFGNHAGLDFSTGAPVSISDGETYNESIQNHSEGTSVIADSSGNLLFYTNGEEIWNRNHQVMPNGDNLLGHLSSTQTLIVPMPQNTNLFYVFTTDAFYQSELRNGLRYSVVDICQDNGSGDVLLNEKNILLIDTVAEKLTAVRHSNGIDYWVITHKYNSDAFYSYLLTSVGISDTVITHVGSVHKDYCSATTSPVKAALGQLKASPDGSKIVCVNGQGCNNISELFDFDNSTGIISNMLNLYTDNIAVGLYGATFSPDNSKIYISSFINNYKIYQYDLSSSVPSTIVNSKTVVANHAGGPWYMGMQLAPDGKIYIAIRNQSSIAVINNPNLAGTSCNIIEAAISLNGSFCSLGLPNFIDNFDYSNTSSDCVTGINDEKKLMGIHIFPNPMSETSIIQFDNSNNTPHTILIFNSYGEIVQTFSNVTDNQVTLDKHNMPNGLYLIQLKTEEEVSTTFKLIIK
ncbi:MAG: T9SS type A sorting domain-containing protein [Flavobacteriales bacterium]|nr:T9SS type A sorting domain-containing protein [Flavobacteriales bacterium]